MAKYRDRTKMGRSRLIPYRPGESALHRHGRRLLTTLTYRDEVKAWCFQRAVTVTISNHGHHWLFVYGSKVAEWWPSTAKLVFQKTYHLSHHTSAGELRWAAAIGVEGRQIYLGTYVDEIQRPRPTT